MKRTVATLCAFAMMSGGLFAWQSAPQNSGAPKPSATQKKSATHKKVKAAPKPAARQLLAQEMPPVPATLMNSAPVKPSVTLEGGLLTIDAPNSTLSDVLSGVRRATGATIEGASPTERVVVKLGPGNPEQVLAALLRGTPYDYVILGAPGKSDVLTRVMLTPQTAQGSSEPAGATVQTQSAEQGGTGHPRMFSPRQPVGGANSNPPDEETAPENNPEEDQTAQPPAPPATQPEAQPQPTQPQTQPDANQPKTPEQLFKELQQLNQSKPTTPQPPTPQ
jgi:hypothetical protein